MKFSAIRNAAALAVSAALLAACGTGTVIKDDGTTDEAKWHEADKVILDKDKGTFPNLQSLSQVRSGMTKDQLYELLGRPQYSDGWRPREWNYLFHFSTPGVGPEGVTTCQYKVLFDKEGFARGFYWNPVEPENAACPPPAKRPEPPKAAPAPAAAPLPPPPPPPPAPAVKRFDISGDALFAFDKSGIEDISPAGIESLDKVASEAKKFDRIESVRIAGHTDRLGSDAYNQALSERRAAAVRDYLAGKGIPADRITSKGFGKTRPVKECDEAMKGEELRACLQPNRRVTVEVAGFGTEK